MDIKLDDTNGCPDEDPILDKQRSEIDRFISSHEHMFEEWDDCDLNYPSPGQRLY